MSMQAKGLVRPLMEGPLDIIGDVHGEKDALVSLIGELGYDVETGKNLKQPERHLVFVGDLVDRGPDSVGVVRMVKRFVSLGNAMCVLGNHEMNALTGRKTGGNSWWFGEEQTLEGGDSPTKQELLTDENERKSFAEFFESLPFVLERNDVVVVHAMWNHIAVEALRNFDGTPSQAANTFKHHPLPSPISFPPRTPDTQDPTNTNTTNTNTTNTNTTNRPPLPHRPPNEELEGLLCGHNSNPIKLVTCGGEAVVETPYFSGDKWRFIGRVPWWKIRETTKPLIVVGHYWRTFPRDEKNLPHSLKDEQPGGEEMFPSLPPHFCTRGVMCIDYSVGVRYKERHAKAPEGSMGTALAALCVPEMVIVTDKGLRVEVEYCD